MNQKYAIEEITEQLYRLSKAVEVIKTARDRVEYIANEMKWDSMLVFDYDEVLGKLASVVAGTAVYAFEEKYREMEIKEHESMLEALKKLEASS